MNFIPPIEFSGFTAPDLQSVSEDAAVGDVFGQIFIQLLEKGVAIGGERGHGLLGLQGPWSGLLITALSESLIHNHSTEFGKFIMNSNRESIPGEFND